MKRGVLEEQVGYKAAVDCRVYFVTCVYDLVQRETVRNDNQCSGLFLRHLSACLCQIIHFFAHSRAGRCVLTEDSVEDILSSRAAHVPVAKSYEEASDLRLEDYDQGKDSDVEHHVHDCHHEPHVERSHKYPYDVKRHNGDEDTHCRGVFDPLEHKKDDKSKQYNI